MDSGALRSGHRVLTIVIMKRLLLTSALILLSAATTAQQPVAVSVSPLEEMLVNREVRASATVVSANEPVVTAQLAALVDAVLHDVGASVSRGELLIRLDDANAELALAQAEANLAALDAQVLEASSRAAKAEELLERDFISDEELIARRAALAVVEANREAQRVAVEAARLDLSRTRITAPFDAVITARQAQVGGYVQPGSPLLTLSQRGDREVDAEIDARYRESLSIGTEAWFDSRGQRWPIRLERLSSVVDPSSRTVRGRFRFVDDEAETGSSGEVVWDDLSGVLSVNVIVERANALGVFVAQGNTAKFVVIEGAQQGRPAAVDLPGDTLVIVRGQTRLQDGDAIEVLAR